MSTAMQRLTNIRVEQLMAREVITIHQDSTMTEAAQLMRNYGVTGLPVVDDYGRCVGILTATDYVHSSSEHRCSTVQHVSTSWDSTGLQRAEVLDNESVRAHMSPRVRTIREHCSIIEAGRAMCEEHIHRLLVVDRQGRPVGIVSSLDLVSALVSAPKE